MTTAVIRSFEPGDLAAYVKFAKEAWGADAYQADPRYLEWLYCDNPAARAGYKSMLLAAAGGRVVGVIHKMDIVWSEGGTPFWVPAIHNLMVAVDHRHGLGLALILASFRGEEHTYIPGAGPDAAPIYRRLKCQQLETTWCRKVLRPVSASWALARGWLGGSGRPAPWPPHSATASINPDLLFHATTTTTAELNARMVEHLNDVRAGQHRLSWTLDSFIWRFFHPNGPRHVICRLEEAVSGELLAFVILSVGLRQGARTARVLCSWSVSADREGSLYLSMEQYLRDVGCHILLVYRAASDRTQREADGARWMTIRKSAESFVFHRHATGQFRNYSVGGAAGDFGFDALL